MHFSSNGFAAVDLAGSSTTYFRSLLYSISGYTGPSHSSL